MRITEHIMDIIPESFHIFMLDRVRKQTISMLALLPDILISHHKTPLRSVLIC